MDFKLFCDYLYASLHVPIYLYDKEELIFSCPEQNITPPLQYLEIMQPADRPVTYTVTSFYSYYGCVQIKDSNLYLIIGPVNDFPYSSDSLLAMSREFAVSKSDFDHFSEFFRKIPTQNWDSFVKNLLFIHYALNHTEIKREEVEDAAGYRIDRSIDQKYAEKSYEAKEESLLYDSYANETELVRLIETGNQKGLNEFLKESHNLKIGVIAHDNLRQWKNMFIVAVTLYSRAAMRGGLTPSLAYQLSNIYMQQVERLTTIDDIKSLSTQVLFDYANRVANSIVPVTADNVLHQVVQYVRENTNKNISVAEIAKHVNFSRPSLSRKVKKELGFELSAFIKKCKLEEARDLLAFTNKSISEISNYLCFSSQSHFQKSFKDQYGITPHVFRKVSQHITPSS